MKRNFFLCLLILFSITAFAQKTNRVVYEQCGTMQRLQAKFINNPQLKIKFEQRRTAFNKAVNDRVIALSRSATNQNNNRTLYTIPIVFHIVMNNPKGVSDAQVQAQLDTLNKDFTGSNGDSIKIPSFFKSLFGKSSIRFCLAQQTPGGESTTGIERITTSKPSFTANDDMKHTSSGGADGWNSDKYFNVWICTLSDNLLGYSTFPEDGSPAEQGTVIDYRSLPGGSFTNYNSGKTLTHETGHYFNLYHIWGDDDGACSGTDYVDDTPNQGNSSSNCYSGIKTDNCTTSGNGIMYENYMDYTFDNCLVMFTANQVERMENAFELYRPSLLNSNGCQPPFINDYDAQLIAINQPPQRLCAGTFVPSVTIKNKGNKTLTALTINTQIDNGSLANYNWTGNLATSATAEVNLNSLSTSTGKHTLTIYVTAPDNKPDENKSNDTLKVIYQYYEPVANVSEGFEGTAFPPEGWDIVNPDQSITWSRTGNAAKTGRASVMISNYDYNSPGQKDDLRLPRVNLNKVDSAFLSFDVAAATSTPLNTASNTWDTLEVLASTDCGETYTSLYKKYGNSLITKLVETAAFIPGPNEWRKDSVNLIDYIGTTGLLLAFRNTNGYENNIYLDNINLRTVTINPNLKTRHFLVTPNPTTGIFAVQFYAQPTELKAIQVFNIAGQKIKEIAVNGQPGNYYSVNINAYAAGIYVVRAVFTDKVLIKKIIKR